MIDTAIKAAKQAGAVLLDYYGNVEVKYKQGPDYRRATVTEADEKSERTIVSILKKKFPQHGIYAEEQSRTNLAAEYVWYSHRKTKCQI